MGLSDADLKTRLVAILRDRSVQHGSFRLASGRSSSLYIDARTTTMSAHGLLVVGGLGLRAIRTARWEADLVGGLTMGADPVAYAIARASCEAPPILDAFSVRKEAKDHGARQLLEGCFRAGARVVVVEDVITSGQSALAAVTAVRAAGGSVSGVLAVVDRDEGGRAAIEDAGLPVLSLVQMRDLGVA